MSDGTPARRTATVIATTIAATMIATGPLVEAT
jgi:hypothetical protein